MQRSRSIPLATAIVLSAALSVAYADAGHHMQPGYGAPAWPNATPGSWSCPFAQPGAGGSPMAGTPGFGYGTPAPHQGMHDMMMSHHGFGYGAGPAGMGPGMHEAPFGAATDLGALAGDAFDAAFLATMIAHHQGAVAAADAALSTSNDPFVRQAAEDIVATQQAEIDEMASWLTEWFGRTPSSAVTGTMGSGPMGMGASPWGWASLTPDQAFLAGMTQHHQEAIDMAQLALERSARTEILDLASTIIRTQSAEIRAYSEALRGTITPR